MVTGEVGCVLLDLSQDAVANLHAVQQAKASDFIIGVLGFVPAEDVEGRVAALEAGAENCVSKQLDPRELVARLRGIVRRQRRQANVMVEAGAFCLDLFEREVVYGARRAVLTGQEFAIVRLLSEQLNLVVSRATITRHLHPDGKPRSHTAIDAHIHAIRKKLGADVIANVRGLGWMISNQI